MDNIRLWLLLHVIFVPYWLIWTIYDANHPEVWDTWYRNPAYGIPYGIALEVIAWGILLHGLWKERRQKKTLRMMEESKQLRMQGRHRKAEILWQQAVSRIK